MNNQLYTDHIELLQSRWEDALHASAHDVAVIAAGQARPYFLDDQAPPHQPNPYFAQWYPSGDCQGSMLLVKPGARTRLLFLRPSDYWHKPPDLPDWADALEVETFASAAALDERLQALLQSENPSRCAMIGEEAAASNLPLAANPAALLHQLHFQRAYKTRFELDALRGAARLAVAGHRAAAAAFECGASEFAIHMAYLAATEHTPEELPYPSIVAVNEHAGILHYQHYERRPPRTLHSFLLDAGATCDGYAADVTRTYAARADSVFAELIERVDAAQQALIATIRPGANYLDYHDDMHRRIGNLLADSGLVACSGEQAYELGITRTFLPHGLGHLIGLQTHDVGGQQQTPAGIQQPPPDIYPALRLTREVAADMVFTIEPGLYFIPELLRDLRASKAGGLVSWSDVEPLIDCGGIRIEDNVLVTSTGVENFTRDAFAMADGEAQT